MKKLLIFSVILMGALFTSCDGFLDINTDPDSPSDENITSAVLLPGGEMNLTASYGDYYRIVGGYFSQHFAQQFGTSNYLDYSQFNQSATRSSNAYAQLYQRAINSFTKVQEKATASKDWATNLAATALKAFAYQAIVDAYGEAPYTEAIKPGVVNPKYDDGATVYAGLVAELDDALSKVQPTEVPATNFLFKGQNAQPWIRFANALKLKLLTRESGAVDVQAQLDALIAQNNFPTEDVAYVSCWKDESGQMNPYYAEEITSAWGSNQQNVIANIALVGTMQTATYTDPRLAAWYNPNEAGNFTGGVSGTNFSTTAKYKAAYFNRPNIVFNSPVYLISRAEVEFFIAEYYAKKNDAANAQTHYEAAIKASFESAPIVDAEGKNLSADAKDALAEANISHYPYAQANWKQVIGLAKWIALAGTDDYEAWCELRRLKYPAFGQISATDIYDGEDDNSYNPAAYVPGTLYTPYHVSGAVGNNSLLQRWPFAESSSSRNGNVPKFKGATTPVFWAK